MSNISSHEQQDGGQKEAGVFPLSRAFVIPCHHGLHMRVAARIVTLAKHFPSRVHLVSGDRQADAKSIISLMELGAVRGETVRIVVEGSRAQEVLTALTQLFESEAMLCHYTAIQTGADADEDG